MALQHQQLHMTWLPSLLSHKRKTDHPVGLKNLGNSCYLNSVLQCLTYTPPLANFCLRNQHSSLCDSASEERKRDCPFCILEKRIVRSLKIDLVQDAPSKIQSCIRIFAEHFRGGRQEDAHEFLRYVIDACHNTCLRLKKLRRKGGDTAAVNGNGGNTVVKEIFGGALQSQVKCLTCGSESNKVDEIMDISLDVLHSNSLKDAMQKFFQPEVLDGNNKYKCDNCKKLVAAKKQMSILQAPNVLVIQLKRFEGIMGCKIDKAVAFEDVLVLSSFMCKASQDPLPEYKLFGTIVHSGYSPESGHYYAYIKDAKGRWYCCDDSSVSLATLKEVLSEKVYILFFSRTNQRPVPHSNGFSSNGLKTHHLNGSQASEGPKVDVPPKVVLTNSSSQQSPWKVMPTMSKNGKEISGPRVKFNFNGNSTSKRCLESVNGKVDVSLNHPVVTNGHVKDSDSSENANNNLLPTRNGSETNKVDVIDNTTRKGSVLTNKNNGIQSIDKHSGKPELTEVAGRTRATTGKGPENHNLESNGLDNKPKTLGNKRKKPEATCILLAHDGPSQERIQELKEILAKEAKSVLGSCGWTDKVYGFMSSQKRLRAQDAGNSSSEDEIKRLLINNAKGAFISQIPESLKEDLIGRLRLFSEEKVQLGGP